MTVEITFPWWVTPYLQLCKFFAELHGLDPDGEKIAKVIVRHAKLRIV